MTITADMLHGILDKHGKWLRAEAGGSRAVLSGAVLSDAVLSGAVLPPFAHCPDTGEFTAWKATQEHIVKLLIPAAAARTSSIAGRKCRAEFAIVQAIYNGDGTTAEPDTTAIGKHGTNIPYRVGETVRPDSYDPDIRGECTHGIHFFVTVREAVDFGKFDDAAAVTARILEQERVTAVALAVAADEAEPSAGDALIRMEVERG